MKIGDRVKFTEDAKICFPTSHYVNSTGTVVKHHRILGLVSVKWDGAKHKAAFKIHVNFLKTV